MLENHHARQAYERFRLQWMINHGYSLEDLVRNLESMILEDEMSLVYGLICQVCFRIGSTALVLMAPSGPALRSF